MKAPFSIPAMLAYTTILALSACTSSTTHGPYAEEPSPMPSRLADSTAHAETQKDGLTKIYTRAIGDYIGLVNNEYSLSFDTLFFGKHVYGQADDFPDIELPARIEQTIIKPISPEQGEKIQEERKSSFYINLVGSVDADRADFIFVAFSNGFSHQFDCFINYKYNIDKQGFEIENVRFENYRYGSK